MSEPSGEVPVTFARGVREDVAELTATAPNDDPERTAEIEALKRRIAELLVECRTNPFLGEPIGRRAECHWLAIAPRAGLRAHRKAQQRSRSD